MSEGKKHAGGRPTKYKVDYHPKMAFKLCLLGSTDKQMADIFEINEDTLHEWKKVHPEFSESLIAGKENADAKVAESLYKKAIGYNVVEEKLTKEGEVAEVLRHVEPETKAQIFWLKNRQKAKWRDRHEVDNTLNINIGLDTQLIEGRQRLKSIMNKSADEVELIEE